MGFPIFTWPDLTKKVLEDHNYGNLKIVFVKFIYPPIKHYIKKIEINKIVKYMFNYFWIKKIFYLKNYTDNYIF